MRIEGESESNDEPSTNHHTPKGIFSKFIQSQSNSGVTLRKVSKDKKEPELETVEEDAGQIDAQIDMIEYNRSCCAVKLQLGVNRCNLLSLYLFQFILSMVLQVQITLLSYLIYEISPDSNTGKVVGNLGFYADITVVLLDLVLGYAMDLFGRKTLSLTGFIIAGAAQIIMPVCPKIYPGMLICRILIAVGLLPALNTPLVLDYV